MMSATGKDTPSTSNKPTKHPSDWRPPRILLAEDDVEMRSMLVQSLHERGFVVDECVDGTHLVARLVSSDPDYFSVIVSDVRMPGITGLQFLEHLRECTTFPPTILITAFGDEATHARAKELGAAAILDKPFEVEDLVETIRQAIEGGR